MAKNPCKGICTFHSDDPFCIGCKRTNHERNYWGTYTEDQRVLTLKMLIIRDAKAKENAGNSP